MSLTRFKLTRGLILRLARQTPEKQANFIRSLSLDELLRLDGAFEGWGQIGQYPPSPEGWRVWLMLAGRGFGKTRAGAEWIHSLAGARRLTRFALVGATIAEARSVMVEGPSGLIAIAKRYQVRLKWEPSTNRLRWPSGAQAQIFSGDNANGLRGPEHDFAWCDELAKWGEAEAAWDNLQMGLRAGVRPRALVTTTPKPMRLLERLRKDPWTVETGGKTGDNINLSDRFIEVMTATYGGTRFGRQEIDGELIADAEGSLWPRELIERCRRDPPVQIERVVVGVDPPAGAGPGCDACGIIVAGRAGDAIYVLADETVQGLSPEGWARAVAAAAARWKADRVVAEANNGGAMVASVLKAAEAELPLTLVHASRGKVARAEPIALKFEAGRAYLAGRFPELEDEMAGLVAGGGYAGPGRSPDRADAMVWAMTELGGKGAAGPSVRRL